jgi:hypothetical protein
MVSNSGTTISRERLSPASSVPLQQAAFLLQQQHLQQVAHLLGVADDVVADGVAAVAFERVGRGLEHRQLRLRQRL